MIKKIALLLVLSSSIILSGCDDEEKQTQQNYPQQQQYAQQPTPQTVVVSGNSGPSMGDMMVGAAVGTMVGNALSTNNNQGYRDNGYRSNNRTTIVNNHYNTTTTRVSSPPVKKTAYSAPAKSSYSKVFSRSSSSFKSSSRKR